MWCTRWFLPLLLLPLPTAPPYFLVLFLLSLFIQAKPCFYCIVVLVTLFFSSCYWQPFPIDSPLSTPWADNITTFAEALNATLTTPYDKPLPPVVSTLDRCWCDFWGAGFFEPYNVSQWERASITKLAEELDREYKEELAALVNADDESTSDADESINMLEVEAMPRTTAPTSSPTARRSSSIRGVAESMWSVVHPYLESARSMAESSPLSPKNLTTANPEPKLEPSLAPLRWEYDLRPYGLGVVVDFGWTRSS
ncbi:hypothetical protein R3P38DRAFT_3390582 [Favolaschia claudopus]|uniref:Uncharacterized protein n=1 Tax=Favolaschia claudopus TaxID=2862362 RepID=A0AAW0CQ86_9AGAR